MTDIALKWTSNEADLNVAANDLEVDESFETAVIISLFSHARAARSDRLPDGWTSRQGWWGNTVSAYSNDNIGSKLYLLSREKQTEETRLRAIDYAREALQWLIEDRATDRIDVDGAWIAPGVLQFSVTIYRPQTDPVEYRFNYNWDAQQERITQAEPPERAFQDVGQSILISIGDGIFLAIDEQGTPLTIR